MIVKLKLSALRETKWHEYAVRFGLGGLATVAAGLIAGQFGPVVGGLFLAFPAIFCASATLVEKRERERKQRTGQRGERRGQQAAALDSAGAVLGSFGLLAFAAVMWRWLPVTRTPWVFAAASAVWLVVSLSSWWARRFMHRASRSALPDGAGRTHL